jgi:serine/threonine-protein kinase
MKTVNTLTGELLGVFQIIKLLGQGGMSSVYLALDTSLERQVALKIPHERFFQDAKFVDRFMREARAMAKLKHTNIVQIYTVGAHEDIPFFAMEYVEGKPLSDVIAEEGPLNVSEALGYLKQIAAALGAAHEMHVIHRDIKPANILVEPSGRVLVTDFGVSKILSEDASQQTLALVGTPQYMSPEICLGEEFDHRTDIYSLGALFFEMLTGVPPFKGATPIETMRRQVSETPEIPEELKK